MQTLKALRKKLMMAGMAAIVSVMLWPGTAAAGSVSYKVTGKVDSCGKNYRVGFEVSYKNATGLNLTWHDAGDKPNIYRGLSRAVKSSTSTQTTTLTTNSTSINTGSLGYIAIVTASHASKTPTLTLTRIYCQPLI